MTHDNRHTLYGLEACNSDDSLHGEFLSVRGKALGVPWRRCQYICSWIPAGCGVSLQATKWNTAAQRGLTPSRSFWVSLPIAAFWGSAQSYWIEIYIIFSESQAVKFGKHWLFACSVIISLSNGIQLFLITNYYLQSDVSLVVTSTHVLLHWYIMYIIKLKQK